MSNLEIRHAALSCRVAHWEIAEKLNISANTFHRRMRRELPTEDKEKIMGTIREIAIEHAKEACQ